MKSLIDYTKLEDISPENVHRYLVSRGKGKRAEDLLNNPMFQEVKKGLREQWKEALVATTPGSDEAKHLHYMIIAIDQIDAELTAYINDGRIKGYALEEKARLDDTKRAAADQRIAVPAPRKRKQP
jgi:hypothetical protein